MSIKNIIKKKVLLKIIDIIFIFILVSKSVFYCFLNIPKTTKKQTHSTKTNIKNLLT